MKIVVIGTGRIGSKIVTALRARNYEVVAASPSLGINAVTGEGLAGALAGAQIVVDVANSPSFEDQAAMDFFMSAGRNLASAEVAAGVKHHAALSVVGTDRLQAMGYFRAKLAQEQLIKSSGIPYTIVHSTQFFEFLGDIAQSGTEGQTVRASTAALQPIAADDVAAALVEVTLSPPINGIVEIAGPDRMRISEAVERYLRAINDPRKVIPDAKAGFFGIDVDDRSLTPDSNARLGAIHLDAWLRQQPRIA